MPAASRPLTVTLLILTIAQPALSIAVILLVGAFVDRLPAAVAQAADIWPLLLAIGGLFVLEQLAGQLAAVVEWRLGQRLNGHLDDRLMASMLEPADLRHLDDSRTRDLAAEVAAGLGTGWWRPAAVPGAWRRFVGGSLATAFSIVVVLRLNWWIGVVFAVAITTAIWFSVRQLAQMMLEVNDEDGAGQFRRLDYERDLVMSAEWGKEIRVFGFGGWIIDSWYARLAQTLVVDVRKMGRFGPRVIAATALLVAVVAVAFGWVADHVASGALAAGAAIVLVQALLRPLADVESIGRAHFDLTQSTRPLQSLTLLEERLAAEFEPPARSGDRAAPEAPMTSISFRDVRFRYPHSDHEVLSGVDIEIPVGSSLAIVGSNGAGKTTLIKLLCRFCEPSSGSIMVDGTDIAAVDTRSWQRRIAAIFQDYARFPVSARDNVRMGNLGADDAQVANIAERTGIAGALATLPRGWETTLGKEFSGGGDLSGGQWQRVALSRALLAGESGAKILVLDEPAANLDVRAEAELNRSFLDLTRGLTTVLVSHRFSTVRLVDRICVLEHGRIVEAGSHLELMEMDGRYAEMFRLQAARYAV
jgi:ABC-type multidrug transport system fused ATPase/permease subunit